jgi:tetratricopeptide (TPR) repeat protein
VKAEGRTVDFRGPASAAWIEFRETGRQIALSARSPDRIVDLSQPLRFASRWVRVDAGSVITVTLADSTSRHGEVSIVAHCDVGGRTDVDPDWLIGLGVADRQIGASRDEASLREALASVDTLQHTAATPERRALAMHYRALALTALNRMPEAIDEFGRVQNAWRALGRTRRAQAARVGKVEAQFAAGRMPAVLASGPWRTDRAGAVPYFDARIANARCLALEDIGNFDQARPCYRGVIAQFRRLNESNDYASSLLNLANVERKSGHLALSRQLCATALKSASGPYAPMTLGRLHALLGTLDRQTGRIASAFHEMQLADDEFRHAGAESLNYRAYGRVYEAMLLEQTGAYHEAYSALDSVWTFLSPDRAGSLLPLSARVFADLEHATHHPGSALLWMRSAERAYAGLGLGPSYEVTRLARLQIQLEEHDYLAVERGLARKRAALPLYEPQWKLLEATLAIRQDRLPAARAALDLVRTGPLSLRDQTRLALTEAEYADRNGNPSDAQRILLARASQIALLARQATSPTLRYVITRQVEPLRRTALRLALEQRTAQSPAATIATIWPWIGSTAATAATDSGGRAGNAEQFDRAVAEELLDPSPPARSTGDSAAQQELLKLLAQPVARGSGPASRPTVSLASIQSHLDRDTAYVAFLDGDERGALLWVTHDGAQLIDTASPATLRTSVEVLLGALDSADSPIVQVRQAALALSAQLFGALPPGHQPPRRLLVQSNELLERVAWSVLTWPGRQSSLLDGTDVELVLLTSDRDHPDQAGAAPLHVIVAAQQTGDSSALPDLATAAAEPELIRATAVDHPISVATGRSATREALLAALGEPHAWVHVAAHGTAQPGRLGYSGLWLEPSAGDTKPPFLSWLDILDQHVRADLVVLDACRLGERGNANGGNISFASAIARSGANRVVAAMWPVSDSAAAMWVPAFYSALRSDAGHDAAHALRMAQQRLRDSRAFRHPFFWAGMQALARMPLASADPGPAHADDLQGSAARAVPKG